MSSVATKQQQQQIQMRSQLRQQFAALASSTPTDVSHNSADKKKTAPPIVSTPVIARRIPQQPNSRKTVFEESDTARKVRLLLERHQEIQRQRQQQQPRALQLLHCQQQEHQQHQQHRPFKPLHLQQEQQQRPLQPLHQHQQQQQQQPPRQRHRQQPKQSHQSSMVSPKVQGQRNNDLGSKQFKLSPVNASKNANNNNNIGWPNRSFPVKNIDNRTNMNLEENKTAGKNVVIDIEFGDVDRDASGDSDEEVLRKLEESKIRMDHFKDILLEQQSKLRKINQTMIAKQERRDSTSKNENNAKCRICPMCEMSFGTDVTEEVFESHVMEHLYFEDDSGDLETMMYVGDFEEEEEEVPTILSGK